MSNNHFQKNVSIFVLGIDMGTSGIRGVIVEKQAKTHDDIIRLSESIPLNSMDTHVHNHTKLNADNTTQSPEAWIALLDTLLLKIAQSFELAKLTHLIVDATSSTVLLCSPQGKPLTQALMYNNQQAFQEAKQIQQAIGYDPESAAQGASSTLAKVLFLWHKKVKSTFYPPLSPRPNHTNNRTNNHTNNTLPIICHQIDFINHYLCGCLNHTDENNALKLGYNSLTQRWPKWITQLLAPLSLPTVVAPGTPLGFITEQRVKQYGFSPTLKIHAGTTDSIAGFLASGASQTGDTVISLGSTLAIKMISPQPVFNRHYGIYSHKLNSNWLVGGASNTGGAVLLKEYTLAEIDYLIHSFNSNSLANNALKVTNDYYPLVSTGERFPIADLNYPPKMPNKPKCPLIINPTSSTDQATLKAHQTYFLNMIKGLVYIEDLAYKKLAQESGQTIKRLYSVGGGEKNALWQQCRTAHFATQFTLKQAHSLDAAYGVTQLI